MKLGNRYGVAAAAVHRPAEDRTAGTFALPALLAYTDGQQN